MFFIVNNFSNGVSNMENEKFEKDLPFAVYTDDEKLSQIHPQSVVNATQNRKENFVFEEKKEKENTLEKSQKCFICDEEIESGSICDKCKTKILQLQRNFDTKKTAQENRDHYFNLRNYLYKNMNKSDMLYGYRFMSFIANEASRKGDKYLMERLKKDIEFLKLRAGVEMMQVVNETTKIETEKEIKKKWSKDFKCSDGHFVRSEGETLIDNWLFNNNIAHSYEKAVYPKNPNMFPKFCDFYLPQYKIYIEYWGMPDEKYEKNKFEKQKIYVENNLKLINIERENLKDLDNYLSNEIQNKQI